VLNEFVEQTQKKEPHWVDVDEALPAINPTLGCLFANSEQSTKCSSFFNKGRATAIWDYTGVWTD